MNNFLLALLVIAILGGILKGIISVKEVEKNPSLAINPSKNLFTFVFTDKY